MCKIIVLTNASMVPNFDKFSRAMAEILSDQRDGFGYIAQGKNGNFGIRSLHPIAYATNAPSFTQHAFETIGSPSPVVGAALFHGRISTNVLDLKNTHPIQRDDWALIHNGVVSHHGPTYSQSTSNDSEHVLFNLINGIDSVAANLTGYYAFAALDPLGKLHIARDAIAPLVYAWSETLQSGIFASNESIIDEISYFLAEDLHAIEVKAETYLIFESGNLIHEQSFVSRGYDAFSQSKSRLSLGYDLNDSSTLYTIPYSDSEDSLYDLLDRDYLWEIENLNDSYEIIKESQSISISQFDDLTLTEKIDCTIIRNDGTVLSPRRLA